jgi:hypothetical protein
MANREDVVDVELVDRVQGHARVSLSTGRGGERNPTFMIPLATKQWGSGTCNRIYHSNALRSEETGTQAILQ